MISTSAPASVDPQRELDLRAAARHLAVHPLVLSESDPDMFRLLRRYEHELDRWFTHRFGYRLEVTADTVACSSRPSPSGAVRYARLRNPGDRSRCASTRCSRSHWQRWPQVRVS